MLFLLWQVKISSVKKACWSDTFGNNKLKKECSDTQKTMKDELWISTYTPTWTSSSNAAQIKMGSFTSKWGEYCLILWYYITFIWPSLLTKPTSIFSPNIHINQKQFGVQYVKLNHPPYNYWLTRSTTWATIHNMWSNCTIRSKCYGPYTLLKCNIWLWNELLQWSKWDSKGDEQ